MLSPDEQIARVVDVIAEQFNGDTAAYFDAVARPEAPSEREAHEDHCVQSFLRSCR
jgi:hypothetical protein